MYVSKCFYSWPPYGINLSLKVPLDNILKCSFLLDFIYQIKIDCLFTNTKRKKSKIHSKSEEIINLF